MTPTARLAALEQARTLSAARDYPRLSEWAATHPRADLTAEPELGLLVAAAWRRLGHGEAALDLIEEVAAVCRERINDRVGRDCLHLQAMLRFELGEIDAAEDLWRRLLEAAGEAGDEDLVARANNNLGLVCLLRGHQEQALACHQRSITVQQRRDYRRGLAEAHRNLAITYREMGFDAEADAHFLRALRYARADRSEDEMARIEQERALLICYLRRDGRLAEAMARRALRHFRELHDPVGAGDAARVLAVVLLSRGRVAEARMHLTGARHVARVSRHRLLEAETLEALAALEIAQRNEAAADRHERDAEEIFCSLGAVVWGMHVRSRMRGLIPVVPPWFA